MGFSFNISKSTSFKDVDPTNVQTIFDLGIFLKLPKDFLKLAENKKIKIHRFDELQKNLQKWLYPTLGSPCFGPLHSYRDQYSEEVMDEVFEKDIEEAWILGATFKDRRNVAPYSEIIINRGIVDNKFIYDQESYYLGTDHIFPWINIVPGFIKSKELGWIGWAYVCSNPSKQEETKLLVTWNHHRRDACYQELYKKIKKFFTITGESIRWLMGRSSVDDEWEEFLRTYNIYVIGNYRKK